LLAAVTTAPAATAHALPTRFSDEGILHGPQIGLLEDPDGKLTPEQAQASQFEPFAHGVPNLGYTPSTWWFRLRVVNDGAQEERRYLGVEWPRLNHVDVYVEERSPGATTSGFLHARSGWLVPFAERPLPMPIHEFPISLAAGEERTVLIRVNSASELILPLVLRSERALFEATLLNLMLGFLYNGVLVGLGLYNLVLACRLRQAYHWLYVGQVSLFLLYMLLTGGYFGMFTWLLPLGLPLLALAGWGWLFFHVAFARNFMATARVVPKYDRFLVFTQYGIIPIAFILNGFVLEQQQTDIVLGPFMAGVVVAVLIAAILGTRGKVRAATWYLYAQTPMALGFVLATLVFAGVLQVHPALAGGMILIGTLAELVVLSVALSEHMRTLATDQAHALRALQLGRLAYLRALVASVTHELNSPLGSLRSSADSLSRIPRMVLESNEQRVRERALAALPLAVQTIERASQRISRVVRSLKDFSGLDESERKRFDLHAGLDGAIELLHQKLTPEISIDKRYGEVPEFYGFVAQLNQAFLHLLSNAVEALNGKGTVCMTTRRIGERVEIEIRDDGRGIESSRLQTIFSPNLSSQGERVHIGLGLPTSRRIIEDHGGTLQLSSEFGRGTTVLIRLPLAAS
jgi:signal transduction histidine kinase